MVTANSKSKAKLLLCSACIITAKQSFALPQPNKAKQSFAQHFMVTANPRFSQSNPSTTKQSKAKIFCFALLSHNMRCRREQTLNQLKQSFSFALLCWTNKLGPGNNFGNSNTKWPFFEKFTGYILFGFGRPAAKQSQALLGFVQPAALGAEELEP